MAGASAAVERRKASAPRSARAASADAAQILRLPALCLPLIFGGKSFVALVCKTRAQVRRENEIARTIRPRGSGGGGPLELAQGANRGGGGAGLKASLSLQKISCRKKKRASENV